MFSTRACLSACPCGNNANWDTFAETYNIADAFLHAATHAPHPIQAAASKASSVGALKKYKYEGSIPP
jgi:hypothetical protein